MLVCIILGSSPAKKFLFLSRGFISHTDYETPELTSLGSFSELVNKLDILRLRYLHMRN